MLVEFEELSHALAFGHRLDGEAISLHHGTVVVLMGFISFFYGFIWIKQNNALPLHQFSGKSNIRQTIISILKESPEGDS